VTAHAFEPPELSDLHTPSGTSNEIFGNESNKSPPQHVIFELSWIAQEWFPPAVTETNEPAGGVLLPPEDDPQHSASPETSTPHE